MNFSFAFVVSVPLHRYLNETFGATLKITLGFYSALGIVEMLYPVSGVVADVCCGRYRIIALSVLSVWCGSVFAGAAGLSYGVTKNASNTQIPTAAGLVIFVVGAGGFRANSVQFSHDQLLDASNEKISIFLHWFVWTEYVGEMANKLLASSMECSKALQYELTALSSTLILLLATVLLFVSYLVRNSFNCERICSNPYWNVCKVLRFAVKHGTPQGHRSAFTYSDDEKPSRMDFAKGIYGGPFETEVVEDVKTFLRVVMMLFAITIVFSLQVSASYLFSIFGRHLQMNGTSVSCTCTNGCFLSLETCTVSSQCLLFHCTFSWSTH